MSEPLPVEHTHHLAHVVVHPVVSDGVNSPFRRVDILGTQVGKAYKLARRSRRTSLEHDPE